MVDANSIIEALEARMKKAEWERDLALQELSRLRLLYKGPGTPKQVNSYYFPQSIYDDGMSYPAGSLWVVDNATGTLSITGDLGNWSHCWGPRAQSAKGKYDFRMALADFSHGYVEDKLSYGVHVVFNAYATMEAVKRDVLERRRRREITPEDARDVFDCLGDILGGEEGFSSFLSAAPGRHEEYDGLGVYEPHKVRLLRLLIQHVLPLFKEALRRDLLCSAALRHFRRTA